MEGLGKIPYVSGWLVFTVSLLAFYLFSGLSQVSSFLTSAAAAMPAPFAGNVVFVVVLLSAAVTVILKVLDAPPKPGSGQRFKSLTRQLAGRPGVKDPGALAASIGRNKYGKQRFQKLAAAGQRRRS